MRRSKGVSLIEVLVALLILLIGLLGAARMQILGAQGSASALHRNIATQLAYDLADRVRANPQAGYAIGYEDEPPSATNCLENTAACSAAGLADFDLAQWKCRLGSFTTHSNCDGITAGNNLVLPMGDGQISQSGSVYRVEIRWLDDRRQAVDEASELELQQLAMEFVL